MAALTITDLSAERTLDHDAMSAVSGGGAPWVYGWIRPFVAESPSFAPSVNVFEINNNFYADQMINQVQIVDIKNTAANANINVALDERSSNFKR